ncbi:MAG: UDP-N-acetylmuramoyl-L-alanine--D-glutamate ligase [Treponema sp.]|nr:UDP-N-acetylmuramoyl-L-alanine--D-glutamate ligase [Treponema sp.]
MFSYKKGCVFTTLYDIKGKNITVMGLGLNGGGEACVRFFLRHGANVIATDMKTEEQLKPTIDRLAADPELDVSHLTYRLGEHRIEDFENADCVIKNPGVKIEGNKYLAAAKAIETDISIFLHFTKAPIIAVTGSKGKSSTVSAINYGLNKAGFTAFLGGNITVSPLTFLEKTTEKTPVVLELSSWQLADLRGRGTLKPKISVITKIVPDHQNWYHAMEPYVADKRLIYADQTAEDYSIFDYCADEPGTGPECGGTWGDYFAGETKAKVLRYANVFDDENKMLNSSPAFYGVFQSADENGKFCGKVILPGMKEPEIIMRELSVPGEHMKINALNAALVLRLMGVEPEKCAEIMHSWPGIDHRLQFFHEKDGVRFYNDSCATVPEAAAAASQSFGKPVYFLTGGTDKGLSLSPLADCLTGKDGAEHPVKSLYLLAGTATEKLLPSLDQAKVKYNGPYNSLKDMLSDLKAELEASEHKDDVVVFSPGATSFGMFSNEFDRGNKYMSAVKEIFKQ